MLHSYVSCRTIRPNAVSSFMSTDIAKIYTFPAPTSSPVVVGVISVGGGLFGTLNSNGVLTNGDVQAYWASQGISTSNQPTVVIVSVDGAPNSPSLSDNGATMENTVDVETVGSCCATSNLTIILYIGNNSELGFYNVFHSAIHTPVLVKGALVKPSILSCSWGKPEIYTSSSLLTNLNNLFNKASQQGINVCVASGDNGSSDGTAHTTVDFPGSSPYVVCCGGTTLVCPNKTYDSFTVETVWNNNPATSATGGGISQVYRKPAYQSALNTMYRSVPDIATNSDPNTGVQYSIHGTTYVVGGTSISAPAIAAFLACCDLKTFLNPLLYSCPRSCFYDIVAGNNGEYSAGVGYDWCSGLGSINGRNLSLAIHPDQIPALSISISPSSVSLTTLTPVQLTNTILPVHTTNKSVVWSSSNPSVATVSLSGCVTPSTSGQTTITATTSNGKSSSIVVSILLPIGVFSIHTSVKLTSTAPLHLTTSILPQNATNTAVVWKSSNPAIATVSSSGQVTAVRNGTATISATTEGGNLSSSVHVSVVFPPPPPPAPPAPPKKGLSGILKTIARR
jgi:subtilase family serine protease